MHCQDLTMYRNTLEEPNVFSLQYRPFHMHGVRQDVKRQRIAGHREGHWWPRAQDFMKNVRSWGGNQENGVNKRVQVVLGEEGDLDTV